MAAPTHASVGQQITDGQTLLGQLTAASTQYSSQIAPQRAALEATLTGHVTEIMAGRLPDPTDLIALSKQAATLAAAEDGLTAVLSAAASYLPPALATLTALQPVS